jgi:hypothetical protein
MTLKGLMMLDQTCSRCGLAEVAGSYCSACEKPTGGTYAPPRDAVPAVEAPRHVVRRFKPITGLCDVEAVRVDAVRGVQR